MINAGGILTEVVIEFCTHRALGLETVQSYQFTRVRGNLKGCVWIDSNYQTPSPKRYVLASISIKTRPNVVKRELIRVFKGPKYPCVCCLLITEDFYSPQAAALRASGDLPP